MPRKPRLHSPGGLYHVILRGNNRQDILDDDAHRLELENLSPQGWIATVAVCTPIAG